MSVDPSVLRRSGALSVRETDSVLQTLGRGLDLAPVLREGLLLTWIYAAIGSAGRVVVPILIQQSIDRGIVGREDVDVELVAQLGAAAVVAILISGVAFRQATVRLGVRSEQALCDLRSRLIGHILRLSLADHAEERRGGLVARVTSDIEQLAQFFAWGGLAWLLNITLMLIVGAVMIAFDWVLALVAFAVALPLVVVLRAVQARLIRAYDTARAANGEMVGAVTELVSGSATIKAYGGEESMLADVREQVDVKARSQIRANLIGAFLFPANEVFAMLSVSAVIAVGILRGPESGLTAGSLVGFVLLTYRFLEPIAELTEVLDQTQTAVAGLRRVLSVLDVPIGPPEPVEPVDLPPGTLAVDVRDVTFAYRSRGADSIDEPVLHDISVSIPPGQQVALVGETGSGKTTLGRLIARFADPTFGEIDLGGVALTCTADADLRRRLVVVAQEPFLFDDTIAANVAFARDGATASDVEGVVRSLHLDDWVASLGDGLDTRVGERGDQLSAGERQLVALLRAGLADPDVLILDEATSSVDALTEVRIARALERLATSRTTISIAHRLSTAARADRVLVLENGRLVQDGPHVDLVAERGVYARLYESWVSATSV